MLLLSTAAAAAAASDTTQTIADDTDDVDDEDNDDDTRLTQLLVCKDTHIHIKISALCTHTHTFMLQSLEQQTTGGRRLSIS